MDVICNYCSAQGSQDDERCGSCGKYYSGNEELVVASEIVVEPSAGERSASESSVVLPVAIDATSDRQSPEPTVSPKNDPSPKDPESRKGPESRKDPESLEHPTKNSEALVKPRKLSPQFRRRVEMTWQPSLDETPQSSLIGGAAHGAERTLSSNSGSMGTRSATSTLSIGTRRIATGEKAGKADYELKTVIGEGSMGKVWSARQTSLDRNVAVKRPRPELAGSGSIGESQFISEVVVTGQLEHPNIVPIYDLARDAKGLPFYSMKHVQGLAWNELIDGKSLQENLEILMKVCDAIAFAHDRHFLHRDIKPHNVMVGEFGEVSVMDWGIAVSLEKDPEKPWAAIATGPAGTPAYMAPEMAAHNPSELGVVSDVYLLGAVLYEIVAGFPPHPRSGDTSEALLAAAANDIVPTEKTGELVDIARRAMATKIDDRYQSVKEFQDALREYQSHRESIALGESADRHFQSAQQSGSSDEFARARFAYEEAIRLWPGNSHAVRRLRAATIAHAKNALDQENFELGISILSAGEPEHQELLGKLERMRSSRRRLHWFSKIAAVTAAGAILTVAIVTVSKNRELDRERQQAVNAQGEAEQASARALEGQQRAIKAEKKARQSRDAALVAKVEARRAESNARKEKRNAEIAAYGSDIGLAAESIRRNAYNKATAILDGMKPSTDPAQQSVRSRLRHIEWGLLEDASKPGPVENVLSGDRVISVSCSRDGTVMAAAIEDGRALLWIREQASSELPAPVAIDLATELHALAVSSDGRYLATAGRSSEVDQPSHAVKVWDIGEGNFETPVNTLVGHSESILSLSFSADGRKLLSSAADRTAVLWDWPNAESLVVIRDHLDRRVWQAGFSHDQRRVVTACDDGRVRVWDIDIERRRATKVYDLRGHDGPVYAAAFSHDGQRVFSGGYDRRLLCWDLSSQAGDANAGRADRYQALLEGSVRQTSPAIQIGTLGEQHEASIRCISIDQIDGKQYVLTGGNDNTLRVWRESNTDWQMEKVLRGHGRWVRACAFTESGAVIASGAHDGLKLWHWQQYSMPRELFPIAERRFGRDPSELGASAATQSRFSRDGRWVATAYENGTVAVWDLSQRAKVASQLLGDGHALLTVRGAFSRDGQRLMTSAGDNTTRVWDVTRGTQVLQLHGTGWRGAASVHWSDDGRSASLVTGSDQAHHPGWLWRVKDERVTSRLPIVAAADNGQGKAVDITAVSHAPDGSYWVAGDAYGQCVIGSVAAGDDVFRWTAHGGEVRSILFTPDGQAFYTADSDGQIKWWRVASGDDGMSATLINELPWDGPVTALDISDDGQFLIVGHAPGDLEQLPIARLFQLNGHRAELVATLRPTDPEGGRDWREHLPAVQSVQFINGGEKALVSLFFPNAEVAGAKSAGSWFGYQLGYWDWQNRTNDFQKISVREAGEISSAVFRSGHQDDQLLIVGGKGARLWKAGGRDYRFTRLQGSFRPSSSIQTLGFSFDSDAGVTRRLVAGDRDGGLRLWECDGGVWSENRPAAAHLVGHHDAAIVAASFLPGREDQFLSADAKGHWKLWQFDQRWSVVQQARTPETMGTLHCLVLSPDGQRLLAGTDGGAVIWHRDDSGRFAESPDQWQTGHVVNANFSGDGVWVVTSDGDRSVAIWDATGRLVARMSDEDAKGTTAMDFTTDRRRFVTGHHDKRVVIWDTSQLVDQPETNELIFEKPIKELLTLEEHRRGVRSVDISPDGRNLLTSGDEGRTIVWAGTKIDPVTLSYSRTQMTYQPEQQWVRLDQGAILNDPSHVADFRDATLDVTIDGDVLAGERLGIHGEAKSRSAGAEVLFDSAEQTKVMLRPYASASPIHIADVVRREDSDSVRLQVQFNQNASLASVQAVIRAIGYRFQAPKAEAETLEQEASDEQLETDEGLMTQNSRVLRVSISNLHQRETGDDLPVLETTFEIEIDMPLDDDDAMMEASDRLAKS